MKKSKIARNCCAVLPLLLVVSLGLSGCHYVQNRTDDLCDIFQAGVGLTSENPGSGMAPPSLGAYVQVTEFINLGALYFNGISAEMDGRGFFAGPEERLRVGFLPWQRVKFDQDYYKGSENYFKKEDALWTKRMNSTTMRWWNKPAKELEYTFYAMEVTDGIPVMARGWQYWENVSVEVCVSEPFVTHLGLDLRLGFDLSEVSDFVLGIFFVDFKNDDMKDDEYEERNATRKSKTMRVKPASDQ